MSLPVSLCPKPQKPQSVADAFPALDASTPIVSSSRPSLREPITHSRVSPTHSRVSPRDRDCSSSRAVVIHGDHARVASRPRDGGDFPALRGGAGRVLFRVDARVARESHDDASVASHPPRHTRSGLTRTWRVRRTPSRGVDRTPRSTPRTRSTRCPRSRDCATIMSAPGMPRPPGRWMPMDIHAGASAMRVKRTRLPGRWRHVIAKDPSGESVAEPSEREGSAGPGSRRRVPGARVENPGRAVSGLATNDASIQSRSSISWSWSWSWSVSPPVSRQFASHVPESRWRRAPVFRSLRTPPPSHPSER